MTRTRIAAASIVILAASFFAQGCATHIRRPAGTPEPATVKIGTFKTIELMNVTISEPFASNGANQKATKKINEVLINEMKLAFQNVKVVEEVTKGGQKGDALVITPVVEQIKFIGGFARFMVGAMAGNSAVLMKCTYTDKATGEVIAEPEFFKSASAFSGGMYGVADNMMLNEVAKEIVKYTVYNK